MIHITNTDKLQAGLYWGKYLGEWEAVHIRQSFLLDDSPYWYAWVVGDPDARDIDSFEELRFVAPEPAE